MDYSYVDECSLLVSSSDAYSCAWYPYFELLKKYWSHMPKRIYLNSETQSYQDSDIDIINVLGGRSISWSLRLYRCLEKIPTEYIIFNLEDFFLLDYVKEDQLEECLKWMKEDEKIAVVRLQSSNYPKLEIDPNYPGFRRAGNNVAFRVETQAAIWRKSVLMELLNPTENPWQFETNGTERAKKLNYTFLWQYAESGEDISVMTFPYHTQPKYGYGIAWGRWMWNNEKWFLKNEIKGVRFKQFGILSEKAVKLRYRYLYRANLPEAKGIERIIQNLYHKVDQVEKAMMQIRIHGFRAGVEQIKEKRCRKKYE